MMSFASIVSIRYLSYSEIRLVPGKRTERLAEDAGERQRESGTGSDKERGSA